METWAIPSNKLLNFQLGKFGDGLYVPPPLTVNSLGWKAV